MAITRPVTRTIISTPAWGIPITDEVNRLTDAVAAMTPGPWTALAFQNGWSNFDTVGYDSLAYRKMGDLVQFRGVIRGGAVGSTIAIFPVGARPIRTFAYPVSAASQAGTLAPSISVNTAGQLLCYDAGPNPNFVHLGFYQFCTI